MTIIGATLLGSGQRALAWADTEFYQHDKPAGHALKLCANPLLGAVAVCAGSLQLVEIVSERLRAAVELDCLIGDLQAVLKEVYFSRGEARPGWLPEDRGTVGLVAWSHRESRFALFVLSAESKFTAARRHSFASPAEPDGILSQISAADDLAEIARRQMATIRKKIRRAGAGMLVVAEILPSSMTIRPALDLASLTPLHAPMRFAAVA